MSDIDAPGKSSSANLSSVKTLLSLVAALIFFLVTPAIFFWSLLALCCSLAAVACLGAVAISSDTTFY